MNADLMPPSANGVFPTDTIVAERFHCSPHHPVPASHITHLLCGMLVLDTDRALRPLELLAEAEEAAGHEAKDGRRNTHGSFKGERYIAPPSASSWNLSTCRPQGRYNNE